MLYSGSLLFFHPVPQIEKECGADGEEEIEDSQEQLKDNSLNLSTF